MRLMLIATLVVSLTALCAPEALAHGGSFGHGPYGPTRAPSIPCDCAKVCCLKCSAARLESGEGLAVKETTVEVKQRWGDLASIETTTSFRLSEKGHPLEAYASIAPAPLLAITGGRMQAGKHALAGARTPSRTARRNYIWERNRTLRDPMLVLRRGPGKVHLRAFPITADVTTTVTLEGYALVPAPELKGVRIYRTGRAYLVVLPLEEKTFLEADLVDEEGMRAILLLSRWSCRKRFPEAMKTVVDVPCVPALENAIRGAGDAAVSEDTALVALPPGRRAPSNLFVGKPGDAPIIRSAYSGRAPPDVPPGLRDPVDPTPPPPPPTQPPRTN